MWPDSAETKALLTCRRATHGGERPAGARSTARVAAADDRAAARPCLGTPGGRETTWCRGLAPREPAAARYLRQSCPAVPSLAPPDRARPYHRPAPPAPGRGAAEPRPRAAARGWGVCGPVVARPRRAVARPGAHACRCSVSTLQPERRFREAAILLGDDDREIILLRHFEQLSNSDVAGRLPGLASRRRRMRALRAACTKLRAVLGESPSMKGTP